jgi:GTP cyclohydrolase I
MDKIPKVDIEGLHNSADIDFKSVESAVIQMIKAFGENPDREGLERTPERVARMYEELLAGYRIDPQEMVNDALFEITYDEMVIVRDIEFYSLCEHHMLPFLGRAHIAYFPNGRVIGLSKIPRIVDLYARRLQVQERMTRQIADFLNELLDPKGVVVVGLHLCEMCE